MNTTYTDLARRRFRTLVVASPERSARIPSDFPAVHPTTGTEDDDDDPGAEHRGENEAPERAVTERTEAPEEFESDGEDNLGLGDPEDEDADLEEDRAGDNNS